MISRRFHISGRVQGVFFRDWAVAAANGSGVTGWVRNRRDGSVEIVATGTADQLKAFLAKLQVGSRASQVDCVEVEDVPHQAFGGFARKASA